MPRATAARGGSVPGRPAIGFDRDRGARGLCPALSGAASHRSGGRGPQCRPGFGGRDQDIAVPGRSARAVGAGCHAGVLTSAGGRDVAVSGGPVSGFPGRGRAAAELLDREPSARQRSHRIAREESLRRRFHRAPVRTPRHGGAVTDRRPDGPVRLPRGHPPDPDGRRRHGVRPPQIDFAAHFRAHRGT